jgi:hypothetical protein
LNMHRITAKYLPPTLDRWPKQRCVEVCLELWEKANGDQTFMSISRIITGDESWIYGYDPEKSNSRRSGKAHNHQEQERHSRSKVQQRTCSLFIFFAWIHQEFVPPNITVNSDFYCDVLRRLRENMQRRSPNFGATTTGSSITTTRPPTLPWKPQSLWLTTPWLLFPILPTRRT